MACHMNFEGDAKLASYISRTIHQYVVNDGAVEEGYESRKNQNNSVYYPLISFIKIIFVLTYFQKGSESRPYSFQRYALFGIYPIGSYERSHCQNNRYYA